MITKLPINKRVLEHWEQNDVETLIVAIEEMTELQKELTKILRGKGNTHKLVEELTDTLIMLQGLQTLFEIEDIDILAWNVIKQHRTIERIKNNNL